MPALAGIVGVVESAVLSSHPHVRAHGRQGCERASFEGAKWLPTLALIGGAQDEALSRQGPIERRFELGFGGSFFPAKLSGYDAVFDHNTLGLSW